MKLSVDLVDHIFSFLVSDRETLVICSRDPVLFPIVERHLYYFITVHFDNFGRWDDDYDNFGQDHLTRAITENPRIFHYVRILRINVVLYHSYDCNPDLPVKKALDQFAATLLRFPALKCIKLTSSKKRLCDWPDIFRAALEDRLNLPTLKELHIEGNQEFPCFLIDNRKNIEKLSLSGEFLEAKHPCGSNRPQLKSLEFLFSPSYRTFASLEPHIHELRSLKCASLAVRDLPKLLGVCSQTLKKLDIDLSRSCYLSLYYFCSGKVDELVPFPQLPPILPHLAQLTIRATVDVDNNEARSDDGRQRRHRGSGLPAAAQIIKSFPPPQHLILEIEISLARTASDLDEVDFSPLAVLGAASRSIPRIDLYVHTDQMPSADTLTQVLASLADHVEIMRSVEEGNLVVHPEVTAPEYEQGRF